MKEASSDLEDVPFDFKGVKVAQKNDLFDLKSAQSDAKMVHGNICHMKKTGAVFLNNAHNIRSFQVSRNAHQTTGCSFWGDTLGVYKERMQ